MKELIKFVENNKDVMGTEFFVVEKKKDRFYIASRFVCTQLFEDQVRKICSELNNMVANMSESQEKGICENVIHHTCKHFDQINGCRNCKILKFESKY